MTAEEPIELLRAMFRDIGVRAPFGVTWKASDRQLPTEVHVTPADLPTGSFALPAGTGAAVVVDLAAEVQEWLIPQLGVPVPPCPHDGARLQPQLVGSTPGWTCPHGDFECGFGRYLASLWPPSADDPEAAPMLAQRLSDAGIRWSGCGFTRKGGSVVAEVDLFAGEDEAAVRAAAAPFEVAIGWEQPLRTERLVEDGFRVLRLSGGGMRMLASWSGALARPRDGEDADVLVGDAWVRLEPEHRIGGPGEPLLLDAAGAPFADVGDLAICGGGFAPFTGVERERRPFYAWEIRVPDGRRWRVRASALWRWLSGRGRPSRGRGRRDGRVGL